MFLWIGSLGPGQWETLLFKTSARRALFSCSCLACSEASVDVSRNTQKPNNGKFYQCAGILISYWSDWPKISVALTCQDVHPDQFRLFQSVPKLSLETVFSLKKKKRKETVTRLSMLYHIPHHVSITCALSNILPVSSYLISNATSYTILYTGSAHFLSHVSA